MEHEAEIVRWVFESFLNGVTPYAIAEELNRRGEPTGRNGVFDYGRIEIEQNSL